MRLAISLILAAAGRGSCAELPDKARFAGLLQSFVDQAYLKGFRHLGDERDFDHGHLLFAEDGTFVAILYHTQELAHLEGPGSAFGYLDPGGRNWLQWAGDGRVENASAYSRRDYPAGAAWDLFRATELPALSARRTVLDKMLDPDRVRIDPSKTRQWVFTKFVCGAPNEELRVVLPSRESVCLALSAG